MPEDRRKSVDWSDFLWHSQDAGNQLALKEEVQELKRTLTATEDRARKAEERATQLEQHGQPPAARRGSGLSWGQRLERSLALHLESLETAQSLDELKAATQAQAKELQLMVRCLQEEPCAGLAPAAIIAGVPTPRRARLSRLDPSLVLTLSEARRSESLCGASSLCDACAIQ